MIKKFRIIKRISFNKIEFYNNDWIINIPININNFKYLYDERKEKSIKPNFIFENEDENVLEKIKKKNNIKFKKAYLPNFVHSYKIIFKEIFLFFWLFFDGFW